MTKNIVNFTERHEAGGWAKYLPAISGFYTTHLGKVMKDPDFVPASRVPEKFEFGLEGMDFLKKENSYFHYKWGLFSAGHAERNLKKCDDREPMIHKRDRENTVIIGDSGGFQIATGVIKMDWSKVLTEEGDKLRQEILDYLEYTADWSMTLDVPAFAAVGKLSEKTGLTKFSDTIDITEHNLKYFIEHRTPGKTKFLNVLSGSTPENSREWYERVRVYSMPDVVEAMGYDKNRTLEGFAFAGINMKDMRCVLERLLDLREDDLLKDKDWIHFLGIGRLDWACYLTAIERVLRKHYNPNVNISFDAASPFVAAGGYALAYNYNYFTPGKLTYSMSKGLDDKSLKGSKMAMPFGSPIMERLTVGDICVMGPNDQNKQGKIGKTSWDTTSYALIMAHNVYNHIYAVQEINRLADIEYARRVVDIRDWKPKTKGGSGEFVPETIVFFNAFVQQVLDPSTTKDQALALISKYATQLSNISFVKDDAKHTENFNTLWDHSSADTKGIPDIDELAVDTDNEELARLERELDQE